MLKCVLVVCVCLLQICQIEPRVLKSDFPDGDKPNSNKHPYLASILLYNNFRCTGVIIDKSWILTLASCVKGRSVDGFSVRVGSEDKASGGDTYSVKKIVNHNKFDSATLEYDYGLVKLATNLNFNENVSKIDYADNTLKTNVSATTVGWGSSTTSNETSATTVDRAQCADTYKQYGLLVANNMMCASAVSSSCTIENGDPLIVKKKVYGIYSWSLNCEDSRFPGVYSNIGSVNNWIDNRIN